MTIKIPQPVRLLLSVYAVGVIGFCLPFSSEFFHSLTALNLAFTMALLLFYHRPYNQTFLITGIIIYLFTFLIEMAGVQTGIIFGTYSYTNLLGPKLFDTPLIIGINWFILIYSVYFITRKWNLSFVFKALAGALLMVLFDLLLEPVAMAMPMWKWPQDIIPLQNYLAWGVISLFILLPLHIINPAFKNPVGIWIYPVQLVFMGILNLCLL